MVIPPAERGSASLPDEVAEGINSGDSLSAGEVFSRLMEKYRHMAKDDNPEDVHHNDNTTDTT